MAENNEQVGVTTPIVAVDNAADHGLFDFKNKDEDGKPIKEETLAHEFDQNVQVSDPALEVESKDEEEKKDGDITVIPRSYSSSSSSSDEEGDDEETKQRKKEKKEKKGLKEKVMEKLPGHQDEVAANSHEGIEDYQGQEVVYDSEPPQQEEDPEKKGFLDKIKEKLPGQTKTDESHDEEVVLHLAEPAVVVAGEEDKKGFMDKIKDKIPGLSSSKASDV